MYICCDSIAHNVKHYQQKVHQKYWYHLQEQASLSALAGITHLRQSGGHGSFLQDTLVEPTHPAQHPINVIPLHMDVTLAPASSV
jgi:hypothetical protein